MARDILCIGPCKRAVLLQALIIVGLAGGAGAGLEWWGVLEGSLVDRLGEAVGLPLAGLAITGVGASVAGAMAWSSLKSLIEVRPDELVISGHLGRLALPYAEIETVEVMKSRDVGLALRDSNDWESRYEGTPDGLRKLQTLFGAMRAMHGCEIVLERDRIGVGVDRFMAVLKERLSPSP